MKRRIAVCLIFLVAAPVAAHAQEADPLEGTVTKKKGVKDPLYGLSFRFGFRMGMGANWEPDQGHVDLSYQFKLMWNLGQTVAPKTWFKPLRVELRFDVSHQPYGWSSYYRNGNVDPDYRFAQADQLPALTGGYIERRDTADVPRSLTGGGRAARMSDLMLTFNHLRLYKIPKADIVFDGLIRFMFPTSVQSQNATLQFALTAALGASRTFKWKVANKVKQSLTLGYMFGITRFFHANKIQQIDHLYDGDAVLDDGTIITDDQIYEYPSAVRNAVLAYSNDFYVYYGFYKGLTLMLGYGLLNYDLYKLDENCLVQYDPNDPAAVTNVCDTMEDWIPEYPARGERRMHSFMAALVYTPLPYLSLQLLMATQAPTRKPNSTDLQQPFFVANRNGYTSFMLTAYFTVDQLYKTLIKKQKKGGGGEAEQGPKKTAAK